MLKISGKKAWIYVVCVLLVVSFLLFPSFLANTRQLFVRVLSVPVNLTSESIKYLRHKNDLEEDNRALRRRLWEISLQIEQFKDLRTENERLRKLMEFESKRRFDAVYAGIIARNPNDWVGSFMINRGSKDGIKKNAAVCSSEGLLGKITDLDISTGSVMLLTHPGFKAGGTIKNSQVNGIVAGAGDGRIKMMYIPIDANVNNGDIVVTSGFSRLFPGDIPIGKIVYLGKSKGGLYKTAILEPLADPSKQEEVLCVI